MNITEDNVLVANVSRNETVSHIWVYTTGIPILVTMGMISMLVNVRILISIHWIRRPLSATLYISLSLAAADAFTSTIQCVNLIINSYMPQMQVQTTWNECYNLTIEALRVGGIVTTVLHLILLACNHYMGIVKPLHYPSIMTHKKITACLVAMWVMPPIYFELYFVFPYDNCSHNFMEQLNFRIMFVSLLVVPLLIMIFIYTHILVIVQRQQQDWQLSAQRGASCRHRGGTTSSSISSGETRRRHHTHGTSAEQRRSQQMEKNVKAMYTTFLILGSFIIGLLPGTMTFILCCKNCVYSMCPSEVYWIVNVLIFTKTLANPIIYAARMQEIKKATRRMRLSLCPTDPLFRSCAPLCCGAQWWGNSGNDHDSQQLYNSGGSYRTGTSRTAMCRFVSNGSTPHLMTFAPGTTAPKQAAVTGKKQDGGTADNISTVL